MRHHRLTCLSTSSLHSVSSGTLNTLHLTITSGRRLHSILHVSRSPGHPRHGVRFFITICRRLHRHVHRSVVHASSPIRTVRRVRVRLDHLARRLASHRRGLTVDSHDITGVVHGAVRHRRGHVHVLGRKLRGMSFNRIGDIHLGIGIHRARTVLLSILSRRRRRRRSLFGDGHLAFSRTLTGLCRHLGPRVSVKRHAPRAVNRRLLSCHGCLRVRIRIGHNSSN